MSVPDPFLIDFSESEVAQLLDCVGQRLRPAGTTSEFEELCDYWATEFDWKAQQERLNKVPQFVLEVDGTRVHFAWVRATSGDGIPLILGHGWPSALLEFFPLIPLLTDPAAYGLDGPAFDVVIPSLPGYGFSERPRVRAWNYAATATLWHHLMQALEYSEYAAAGSDFGSGVATMMALQNPDNVLGLHLSNLDIESPISHDQPLSTAELLYLAQSEKWWESEIGSEPAQVGRQNTLAFALTDSPSGVAAWITEKWRSRPGGRAEFSEQFGRDELLTLISFYWLTGTAGTSVLDYYDNRSYPPQLLAGSKVEVPTAVAVFSDPLGKPPREWLERLYRLERLTQMPRGGHFAALEEPVLLAEDLLHFFRASN